MEGINMHEDEWAEAKAKALEVTVAHVTRVKSLLHTAAKTLEARGSKHDLSKFDDEEFLPLARMQALVEREGQAPFGSEEYARRTAMLGPMLKHHYENNSHHPEHYPDGIDGMDLFDVMEMFFDWKAASERGEESAMNLNFACERFDVNPQLKRIFENTAERLGYATK